MNFSDWCHSCGREEPLPSYGAYIYCLECGHVYETGRALLETFNREVDAMNRVTDPTEHLYAEWQPIPHKESPEDITFCPLCLHNF